MANRFVLNETSYHGAGAIAEIATETRSRIIFMKYIGLIIPII